MAGVIPVGRLSLAVGTSGSLRFYKERNGLWTARALFRDFDGVTRPVERTRQTKGAAERALREALRDRVRVGSASEITPDTRVKTLAEAWWTEFSRKERSPGTMQIYRDRLDRQIIPSLGQLRVRELTIGTAERFLRAVETRHGAPLAKTVRSVLSGMCAHAARQDALDRNPVRETSPISVKPKKGAPRALSVEQIRQLRALITYDDTAVSRDRPELVDVMAATGIRIGEALALVWDAIDFEARTLEIRGTVIRVKGQGLIIKPEPKTEAGFRTLILPSWCVQVLCARYANLLAMNRGRKQDRQSGTDDLVFPSTVGTLRDPSNVDGQLKEAFIAAGLDITSHVLRKSVATLMDRAGLSARAAADQLGHSQVSVTQNAYYGRKIADTGAARVLEALAV
jgi:integrase